MSRRYQVEVVECGTDCPAFLEDGYACGIHSCSMHEEDMPAEMFQEMVQEDKQFPDFCPLVEMED